MKVSAGLLFVICLLTIRAKAQQSGSIDRSFGTNGYSFANLEPTPLFYSEVNLVKLKDGSIVTAGNPGYYYGMPYIAKYKPDGSRDSSFAGDGLQTFANEYPIDRYRITQLLLQPATQKLLLIADSAHYDIDQFAPIIIRRLNQKGEYDSSFGLNGRLVLDRKQTYKNFDLFRVLIESTGNILLIGRSVVKPYTLNELIFLRFTADGLPDLTYGQEGRFAINGRSLIPQHVSLTARDTLLCAFQDSSRRNAVRITPDGKLDSLNVPGGIIRVPEMNTYNLRWILPKENGKMVILEGDGQSGRMYVRHYRANGTIDSAYRGSFQRYGFFEYNTQGVDGFHRVVPLPEGGCFIAYADMPTGYKLLKLRRDFLIDSAFGVNGVLSVPTKVPITDRLYVYESQVCVFEPGFVYLQSRGPHFYSTRYRYTTTGTQLDESFADEGTMTRYFVGSEDKVMGAGLLADGSIMVLGALLEHNTQPDSSQYLLKFTPSGKPDITFGNKGIIHFKRPAPTTKHDKTNLLCITRNNRIVLLYHKDKELFIQRLLPDGTPDTQFGTAGTATVVLSEDIVGLVKVIEQPDKKLLILVNTPAAISTTTSTRHMVVRLHENGQLDNSFRDASRNIPYGYWYYSAADIVYTEENKIVVLANWELNTRLLARMNLDGSLDKTFASGEGYYKSYGYMARGSSLQPLKLGAVAMFSWEVYSSTTNKDVSFVSIYGKIPANTTTGASTPAPIVQGFNTRIKSLGGIVQNDHKFLILSSVSPMVAYDISGVYSRIYFTRYTAKGEPDTAFGTNGAKLLDSFPLNLDYRNVQSHLFLKLPDNNALLLTTMLHKGSYDIALIKILLEDRDTDCGDSSANAGPDRSICAGGPATTLGITGRSGNTYLWTNAQGQSIGEEAQIKVTPASNTTYYLTVNNGYNCVSRDTVQIRVNQQAAAPLPISSNGSTAICTDSQVILTTTGNNLQWLRDGLQISGANSATYSATATGTYSVMQVSTAGCVASSAGLQVTVNPKPNTPSITQLGTLLQSSAAAGNQWHLEGIAIPGATHQQFAPLQPGNYTVQVNSAGCLSDLSVAFPVIATGINSPELDRQITLFPNPVKNRLEIRYAGTASQCSLSLIDIAGHTIRTGTFRNNFTCDMSSLKPGVYVVQITTTLNGQQIHRLIMKQ